MSSRSQGAFSPKTVAPGTICSHTAMIRIRKIPVANSGITENIIPPIDRMRSLSEPSLRPAIMPRSRAVGITMTKAMPASTTELRSRVKMVSATGRPVRRLTPGSPRIKPFFSGMYSTGPPVVFIQPVPTTKDHTSMSVPFSQRTTWLAVSTPQANWAPSVPACQRSLSTDSTASPPAAGWVTAIRSSPTSFQRTRSPLGRTAHQSTNPSALVTRFKARPTLPSASQSLPKSQWV